MSDENLIPPVLSQGDPGFHCLHLECFGFITCVGARLCLQWETLQNGVLTQLRGWAQAQEEGRHLASHRRRLSGEPHAASRSTPACSSKTCACNHSLPSSSLSQAFPIQVSDYPPS